MKTVVITESACGLGFEIVINFCKNDYNVVLSDINIDNLNKAVEKLQEVNGEGKIIWKL